MKQTLFACLVWILAGPALAAADDGRDLYGRWVLVKKDSAPFCFDPKDIESVGFIFAPGRIDSRDPLRPWQSSPARYTRDGAVYVVSFASNMLRFTLDEGSLTPEGPFGQPGLCHFERKS